MASQRFIIDNKTIRQKVADAVMAITDKPVMEVIIQPYRKKRSGQSNRYYWGCVVGPLAEHTGYTPAEMHEEILGAYVGWETREVRGHIREFPRRTSTKPATMETMDFKGLIETGQRIAAEIGVMLHDQDGI